MTDEQLKAVMEVTQEINAWRSAVAGAEDANAVDDGVYCGVLVPPAAIWDAYKQAVLEWAQHGLAAAQAKFAAL
jgi:hypothetical protein